LQVQVSKKYRFFAGFPKNRLPDTGKAENISEINLDFFRFRTILQNTGSTGAFTERNRTGKALFADNNLEGIQAP